VYLGGAADNIDGGVGEQVRAEALRHTADYGYGQVRAGLFYVL